MPALRLENEFLDRGNYEETTNLSSGGVQPNLNTEFS